MDHDIAFFMTYLEKCILKDKIEDVHNLKLISKSPF